MESERPKKKSRLEAETEKDEEISRLKNRVKELEKSLEEAKGEAEGKMVEFRKLVECPVCLLTPREGPVPCCPQGHLVCTPCLDKLKGEGRRDCPTCRGAMGQGKSLLAFAVAEQVQHECRHQGCTTMLPLDQIKEHEKGCNWRLIVCPSAGSGCGAMISFCRVEIHAQDCGRCRWPPQRISKEGKKYNTDLSKGFLDGGITLTTLALQFEGFLFFMRGFKRGDGGNFVVDVVMKGSQEECQGFMIEASMIDVKSGEDKVAYRAIFPPRPLEKVNKERFCLSVPQEGLAGLWVYDAERDKYSFSWKVKIVKLD